MSMALQYYKMQKQMYQQKNDHFMARSFHPSICISLDLFYLNIGCRNWQCNKGLKPSCDSRFQHAFTAYECVFSKKFLRLAQTPVITLKTQPHAVKA